MTLVVPVVEYAVIRVMTGLLAWNPGGTMGACDGNGWRLLSPAFRESQGSSSRG